jgi:hypothetical protein
MRTASAIVISSVVLSSLVGCSGDSVAPPVADAGTPYTSLPQRTTSVSGFAFDPEAFFYALATFPPDPEDPEGINSPPPALFAGTPYLTRSLAVGVQVSLTDDGAVTAPAVAPSSPDGSWQVTGVPSGDTAAYLMVAQPPAGSGRLLTAGDEIFPAPPFDPVPEGRYFPTRSLRPIVASPALCLAQAAAVVGETGALGAVAQVLTFQSGKTVTAADLVDPAKSGGVVLVWVYAPSFVLDLFLSPSGSPLGGLVAEASRGTVYGIDWAPPGVVPEGQSPMGYLAAPDPMSPLGYFAIVLPVGTSGPVTLSFKDQVKTPPKADPGPFGPRPWPVDTITVDVKPGVSVLRHFATPTAAGEPDPDADPVPPPDFSWGCMGGP